ncbi:dihydrolipoyl dehydrogenase [Hahella sp. HN01]|uniref:dihydrolipoyl dehydrogenase n=1 Tax=Hahella sp. HN01 TaxID=2847262 RepID=UPI001C1EC6AB|nr:dihydrolipoyl dehydrogenase [Hahella sp. HN01]MBU6951442.1 dihydrolipoyl dehydrogenase [Hahella sp. HN01]
MAGQTTHSQVVVLGSGPGGYSAAFRAADMGLEVTLIERYSSLGGVCLNVGCIPSKALLHVAYVMEEAHSASAVGVTYAKPEVDLDKVRAFKDNTVKKLTQGIQGMAKGRKVKVVHGYGEFAGPNQITVDNEGVKTEITFDHCIIAAGSQSVKLPFIPHDDPRVLDSTSALELKEIPKRLLIVGGGIIGLEMGTVYEALGSEVSIVEFADQLVPAADKDLIAVYSKFVKDQFNVMLSTKVTAVEAKKDGLYVTFEGKNAPEGQQSYDAILVAVGRSPNGKKIGAEKAGIQVDERGFINTDNQQRTNVPHIYAIGDIAGNPMLAHKATHQGHVAAEVIAGHKCVFDPKVIPSIAYTNPEIAWTGLTEKEAKAAGIPYKTAVFPWVASGRALGAARSEGKTKLIYKEDGTLIGGGIVGINAGELLGELSLAIEFGADVEDLALTIHAHPTLHETVGLAGELAAGTITDLPNPMAKIKKS